MEVSAFSSSACLAVAASVVGYYTAIRARKRGSQNQRVKLESHRGPKKERQDICIPDMNQHGSGPMQTDPKQQNNVSETDQTLE